MKRTIKLRFLSTHMESYMATNMLTSFGYSSIKSYLLNLTLKCHLGKVEYLKIKSLGNAIVAVDSPATITAVAAVPSVQLSNI